MIDVILPVLNEASSIPWVLERMPDGFRPLVVDNGSTDGSDLAASSGGAILVREPQRGFGAACFAGLMAARSEFVCFMDCDGSLDPADLPHVAQPVVGGDADLVLVARVPEPGAWPLHARFANRILTIEVKRRTGLELRDIGPMRCARREQLLRLDMKDRRSGWPLEMVLRAAGAGWRIQEIRGAYRARRGRSKVTGTIGGTIRAVRDMAALLR